MKESNQPSQDPFNENEIVGAPSECLLSEDSNTQTQEENEYKIKCDHRTAPDFKTYFEVVPDIGAGYPYDDTVTIQWTGPEPPETIFIKGKGCKLEKKNPYVFNFKELYAQNKKLEDIFYTNFKLINTAQVKEVFRSMWTWNKYHKFSVSPLIAPRSIDLYLYNPETWHLEISFPPGRKYKTGRKLDKAIGGENKGQTTRREEKSTEKTSIEKGHETSQKNTSVSGQVVEYEQKDESSSITKSSTKGINVWRNGSAEKIDFLTTISSALRFIKLMQYIAEEIKDNVPQVGWYMDYEMSVFEGKLTLDWGWKECVQSGSSKGSPELHNALYEVKLGGEIKLVGLKFEVGLGIKAPGFKAQLFVSIEGSIDLKPSITTHWHKIEDFNSDSVNIPVEGEIKGAGGARVEVGFFVNLQITIESGIYAKMALKVKRKDDWLVLEGEYGFSGIVGKVTFSSGKHGQYGERRKANVEVGAGAALATAASSSEAPKPKDAKNDGQVFLKPVKMGNFKWPSEPVDMNKELSDSEFKKIILSFLEGKILKDGVEDHGEWALTFLWKEEKSGIYTFEHEKIPLELVANEIVFGARGVVIDRSRKSLEGFAHKVRNRLEQLRVRQNIRLRYIKGSDYNNFIRNELPTMYEEIKDPIHYYKLDCTA